MPIIEAKNLNFIYNPNTPFETHALKNVSFSIEEGEFIAIIGHTGSGKSTLIQHINGLLFPTSGEIYCDGEKIDKENNLVKLRQRVGMVFQYPEYQLFEETCEKDIAYGPTNMGLNESEIIRRVKDSLEIVGLDYENIKDTNPFELSGGQKRRVAIAGIIAMEPKVLILDEPTAGLDPRGRDEIIREIINIQKKRNISIIYVTHAMEDIANIADRIMVMNKGEIAFFEEPKTLFEKEEELQKIHLDIPNFIKFQNILIKKGFEIDKTMDIDDLAKQLRDKLC